MNKTIRNITLTGLAGLTLSLLEGCGSCSNNLNDLSRDFVKRDYQVILYDCNSQVIFKDAIENTYVEVSENGSGLRYLKNGKMVMLNGTYILKEQ